MSRVPRRRHTFVDSLKEAGALVLFMAGTFAALFVAAVLLGGCAGVGYAASAASGFYTHQRIDRLEDGRVEEIDGRLERLERQWQRTAPSGPERRRL